MRACNDWLDKINTSEKIPIQQVILETLALHPNLTLREVAQNMKGFREVEIANTLSNLVPIKHRPATVDDSSYDYMHGTTRVREKWQLLSTKIIKVRHNLRGVDTYQLSLFGVLFLLKLIRQNDINRLRHGLSQERPLYERPLLCLLAILKEDSEIQEWVCKMDMGHNELSKRSNAIDQQLL